MLQAKSQQDCSGADAAKFVTVWAHPSFSTPGCSLDCAGRGGRVLQLPLPASEHLPLQPCLQPRITRLKIMEILMAVVANGSFIPSFIHAHPQLSPTAACIFAVAGGGFWLLSACAEHKGNSSWQRTGLVGCGALSTGQNGAGQFSARCLVIKDI